MRLDNSLYLKLGYLFSIINNTIKIVMLAHGCEETVKEQVLVNKD